MDTVVFGAEKTHWSSSVVLDGVTMRAGGHDVLWERALTFVGCELEPSGHSGAALAHCMGKVNGVFLPGDRFYSILIFLCVPRFLHSVFQ